MNRVKSLASNLDLDINLDIQSVNISDLGGSDVIAREVETNSFAPVARDSDLWSIGTSKTPTRPNSPLKFPNASTNIESHVDSNLAATDIQIHESIQNAKSEIVLVPVNLNHPQVQKLPWKRARGKEMEAEEWTRIRRSQLTKKKKTAHDIVDLRAFVSYTPLACSLADRH